MSVFEDRDPNEIDGRVLAENIATIGQITEINVSMNAYEKSVVEIELKYKLSAKDWDFAIEHSMKKGES